MASQPVSMGRYWREASELFFRRPILWVPVLVCDFVGALLNQGQGSLARTIAAHGMVYHSALGGTVQQRGLSLDAARHVYTQIQAIAWTSYFVRTVLYASAFVLTALLVWAADRRGRSEQAFAGLKARASGVVFLALRALAVFAAASIGNTYLMRWLISTQSPILRNLWFRMALSAIVIGVQVMVLTGPALRLLLEKIQASEHARRSAKIMGLLLGWAAVALGYFAGQSAVVMRNTTEGRRAVIEVVGSLITAVPYILMFIGFGVITAVERNSAEDVGLEP